MRRALLLLWLLLLPPGAPAADGPLERGDAAWKAGEIATALTDWGQALEAAQKTGEDAQITEASVRLAAAYRELGRVDSAAKALDLAGAHAPDDAARARVQIARGQLALARGDPDAAEKLLTGAFEAERALQDPGNAATAALSLGVARLARGHLALADEAFSAAATLSETLGDHRGRADALTDRGLVALRQGRLRDARDRVEAALALYEQVQDDVGRADAATDLAHVLQELGRDDLAATRYHAALEVARARQDLPRQATIQQDLGSLAQRRGDAAEARARYTAAERAWTAAGRPAQSVSVALDRVLLDGGAPAALGAVRDRARDAGARRVQAEATLDLALALRRTDAAAARTAATQATKRADALDEAGLQWRAHYVTGLLARDAGDRPGALAALRQAVDQLERTRGDLDAQDARHFAFGHAAVYRALIDLLLGEGDDLGAFTYAERLQQDALPSGPPPAEGALARLDSEQAWVRDRLATAAAAHPDSEQTAALRERLAALHVAFAHQVDTLRAKDPDFDRRVRVAPEDLEALQAHLDPGVTVLQPIVFEDRLVLLVFRRDGLLARTVEVPGADVRKAIDLLARSLRAGLAARPEWTEHLCDQLGSWLLDPIAPQIAHTDVLVVSASGPFRQLPFGLLRTGGKWLVQEVAVAGVTHVGSLQERPTARDFHLQGPGLLLVGDPDGTLPGAEKEVEAIASDYPGADVLLRSAGTEAALEHAAPGKQAIHLATHGRIDPEEPARSHLVLAGPDGRLGYNEIPGLAPWLGSCRLVVLSACESGLPVHAKSTSPDDVIISINGLAAQFRRAGVETLVASLWRVDDESTRFLMVRFYEGLRQGFDIAHALQRAQQQVLAHPGWSHPWYWAGFVVVGDWR